MKKRLFFLIVIAALLLAALPVNVGADEGIKPVRTGFRPDAPSYAASGPYWVGTMEIEVAVSADRVLPATIWYPALNPDGLEEMVVYSLGIDDLWPDGDPYPGHALRDAAPDASNGPYPFVVWSHGSFGTRFYGVYFLEQVASHGFVIMAIEHVGNAMRESMVLPPETLPQHDAPFAIQRPKDVSAAIDHAAELAESGAFEGMIDMERVAVMGLSYGGYTALAIAGAQLDMVGFSAWCATAPAEQECHAMVASQPEMAALAGLDEVPDGLWPSFADARVDAIVAMVPGAGIVGSAGAAGVNLPTLMFAGGGDQVAPPEINAYPVFEGITVDKTLVIFEHGNHGINGGPLPDAWVAAAPLYAYDPVWDWARAQDLTNHFVTAFLLHQFYGDEGAAAALSPDAVAFPGITYETTGF